MRVTVRVFAGILLSCLLVRAHTPTRFPADFEFGTSTSAYQIEGAWDTDGKGQSMWDHLVHTRQNQIYDGTNGDIAANSYHLYKRDVEMLKELGLKNYRFSISWPRVLPYGRPDYINTAGIAYYNAVIDELLANGIEPFVTIYHWDMPQNLNEQGGWLTEKMVDWFGDYARVLYKHFGDRVKYWMTINEPYIHCYLGYGTGGHAPQIKSPGEAYYECGRNVLLANARAYHIYDEEFRATQMGQVGFVVSMQWAIPDTNTPENKQAVEDYKAFHIDHYIHPIFTPQGNYPQIMIDRVAAASSAQGLNASRLRPFTPEQVEYIKGSADFLGLNHYTSRVVYRNASVNGRYEVPSLNNDINVVAHAHSSWPLRGFTYVSYVQEYGPGFYHLLIHLRDHYVNPPIYVTENGCGSGTGRNDEGRVQYFRNYWKALLDAVSEGVNVKGYFAWSLMDNFEWSFGYTIRFGLYEVDTDDPNRIRSPRKSALIYKDLISRRIIDFSYNPDPYAVDALTDSAVMNCFSVMTLIFVAVISLLVKL